MRTLLVEGGEFMARLTAVVPDDHAIAPTDALGLIRNLFDGVNALDVVLPASLGEVGLLLLLDGLRLGLYRKTVLLRLAATTTSLASRGASRG